MPPPNPIKTILPNNDQGDKDGPEYASIDKVAKKNNQPEDKNGFFLMGTAHFQLAQFPRTACQPSVRGGSNSDSKQKITNR